MSQADQIQNDILLIEDDHGEIALARQACVLSNAPLQLAVVPDSEEALEWLSQRAKLRQPMPRLILLDLDLPRLSGLAVLRRLRMATHTWDLPIVVFSEIYEQPDVLLSYQIGANSFVGKPGDVRQFCDLLNDLATYWLQPRQCKLAFAAR
ncbi:MAG: response regulator [Gallionellaceae bacterium]|nr:response regulator [Gallionellaceae bacterium]